MGNNLTADWWFENVLFLDPNLPPFTSESSLHGIHGSRHTNEYSKGEEGQNSKVNAVKRTAPIQPHLRTRVFKVLVDVDGHSSHFLIKCLHEPLVFVLCDLLGDEKRRIPVSLLRWAEKKKKVLTCKFSQNTGSFKTTSPSFASQNVFFITLTFETEKEATLFSETVRLLYGFSVTDYGVSRPDKLDMSARNEEQVQVISCPIHPTTPCQCHHVYSQEENEEEGLLDTIDNSTEYPITIVGKLEPGALLHWKDISGIPHKRPTTIEWRVSNIPGSSPDFSNTVREANDTIPNDVIMSDTLMVSSYMSGKYIQVKVFRRLKTTEGQTSIVTSVATKGPVTLNDEEAHDVLQCITSQDFCTLVETNKKCLFYIFKDSQVREMIKSDETLRTVELLVSIKGLTLKLPAKYNNVTETLLWEHFYAIPTQSKDLHDDVQLCLGFLRKRKKRVILYFSFISQKNRDVVYYVINFFKLQKNFKNFNRWIIDFKSGNYSTLQNRYAKLWASTNFIEDIVNTLIPFFQREKNKILTDNEMELPEEEEKEELI